MARVFGDLFHIRRVLAVGLFMMLAFSGVVFVGGVAKANNWTGRAQDYGYFDNKFGMSNSPYPSGRGPVIDNNDYANDSIPSSVNTKQDVYNYLRDKYFNPGTFGHPAWDKTGASFVVNTMLSNDPAQANRTVSAAMWTDLSNRLASSNLTVTVQNVSASSYGGVNTFYQYGNDDVAWYSDPTEGGKALVFKQGGQVVYVLLYKCANPIGNLNGLPKPNIWTIGLTTTATTKNPTPIAPPLAANEVVPGSKITWNHTIKNNGPDATDTDVSWHYVNSNGWNGTGGNQIFASGKAKGVTAPTSFSYTVGVGDLGKTLCQNATAQPRGWNDPSSVQSAPVCFKVVYRYDLHPGVTVGSPSVEAGASGITVSYSVTNNGPTPSVPNTQWQLTQCTYVPPASAPSSPNEITNGQTAKAMFGSNSCTVLYQGTASFTKGPTALGAFTANTANAIAGTRFCYVMSVSPPSSSVGGWRHSPLTCIAVVKYPKVQALGGDVLAGTVTTRGPVNLGGQFYGSWAQYGIFGMNAISGMASGGTLAGGGATTSGAVLDGLTFANTPSLGNFYSVNPTPNAYFTNYYDTKTPKADKTVGGAVTNGTQSIISVNGDLTINSDITYSGSYNSPADIPRVIYVVNGNIKVDPNVQRIDAWLISNKTLYTCDTHLTKAQQLTTSQCNLQLTFNGPVNVNDTLLGRTYGADGSAGKGSAAEVFNLAPSNYLSSYSASVSASNIQTVYEKELPPRW